MDPDGKSQGVDLTTPKYMGRHRFTDVETGVGRDAVLNSSRISKVHIPFLRKGGLKLNGPPTGVTMARTNDRPLGKG